MGLALMLGTRSTRSKAVAVMMNYGMSGNRFKWFMFFCHSQEFGTSVMPMRGKILNAGLHSHWDHPNLPEDTWSLGMGSSWSLFLAGFYCCPLDVTLTL